MMGSEKAAEVLGSFPITDKFQPSRSERLMEEVRQKVSRAADIIVKLAEDDLRILSLLDEMYLRTDERERKQEAVRKTLQQIRDKALEMKEGVGKGDEDRQHYAIIAPNIGEQIGCAWGEEGIKAVLAEEPDVTFVQMDPKLCPVCQKKE